MAKIIFTEDNLKYLRGLGFVVTTLLMYLGVPLLGWGFNDLSGFFSLTPRLGYALAVLVMALVIGWQAIDDPDGIRGGSGMEEKRVPRQSIVRVAVIVLMYALLVWLPYADRRVIAVLGDSQDMRWAGLALAVAGLTLIVWSGIALGRMYSADVTIQQNHRLISGSIYRLIRHPRYLGVLALSLGGALLFRSWVGLGICLPLLAILLFRIRDEEKAMLTEFGEEWEAYCARSWRLIPWIY